MLEQQIRKLYDHLYANAAVKTPAAIGAEVGKLLQTAMFLETAEGRKPAFPGDTTAVQTRAAFARMNEAWSLYPATAALELSDFDLAYACAGLAGVVVSDPSRDALGDATEIFRSDWAKQAGGQFFTDQQVTRLAMTLLRFDPRAGDDLVDICAGTGGFLLAGLHRIRSLVSESDVADLAAGSLKGQDIDAEVVGVANASLRSRLRREAAMVSAGDSLRLEDSTRFREGTHACIATNPPFGTKITVKDPSLLARFELAAGGQGVVARAPDILFLEQNLRLLKPGRGRMAVVIPYQLLSGPQARFVREWLWRHGRIDAVIDLPVETFQPHTGTKASLVLVTRRERPLAFAEIADDHDIFFSTPRWIGHDRRGNAMFDAARNVVTDFPAVAAAFEHFTAHGDAGRAHGESFLLNAREVLGEPGLRLNATFYAARPATSARPDWQTLATYTQRIFCPGRFKRRYVDRSTEAVPFLGGANISELMPTGLKYLGADDPKLRDLRVAAGWILVTRSGSTGIVATVPKAWDGWAMSEHVIRIIPDPAKIDPAYLLALLRSDYGRDYLARGIFGSVIDEITPAYVGELPVPPPGESTAAIIAAVKEAEDGRAKAMAGLKRAAELVEALCKP